MRGKIGMAAASLSMGLCLGTAAWAQGDSPPSAAVIAAGQNYDPPKIGANYAQALAEQPNFQGNWQPQGGVFDPQHLYEPYKSPPGYRDFGPIPGSYLTDIPYKPQFKQAYAEAVAKTASGLNSDTFAACRPYGMPRFMGGAGGFDIMQGPELVVLQDNYDNETRRIFIDGRSHPSATGAEGSDARTYTGHSVGRWEGNTLVVDTVNMLAGVYDDTLSKHSDQVHLTERFRLIGPELLEVKIVVEDPVMLTRPWRVAQYYARSKVSALENQPAGDIPLPRDLKYTFHNLFDRPCQQTIDMSSGFQSLILPQEQEKKAPPPAPAR